MNLKANDSTIYSRSTKDGKIEILLWQLSFFFVLTQKFLHNFLIIFFTFGKKTLTDSL